MLFKRKPKTTIITIHGFGKNVSHEFDSLTKYLKSKKYEVVQFDMYDPKNPKDDDPKKWIQKAEQQMNQYKSHEIILIGFSMGGVIASYLASVYKIKSLILIAPAFHYLDLSKVTSQGVKFVKNIRNKTESIPSSTQTKAFTSIVSNYREAIYQVDCPICIFHGTKDEVIPIESSKTVYKKLTGDKRLIFIEDGKHRMLYDGQMEQCIFVLIEQAILQKLT